VHCSRVDYFKVEVSNLGQYKCEAVHTPKQEKKHATARRLYGSFDRSVREVVEQISPEGPVGALASWVRQYRWSRRGP